jgi:hypothetical protein
MGSGERSGLTASEGALPRLEFRSTLLPQVSQCKHIILYEIALYEQYDRFNTVRKSFR